MAIKIDGFRVERSPESSLRTQNLKKEPQPPTQNAPKDEWKSETTEPNEFLRMFSEQKFSMNEFIVDIATAASQAKRESWWSPELVDMLPPLPADVSATLPKNDEVTRLLRAFGADRSFLRVDLTENSR